MTDFQHAAVRDAIVTFILSLPSDERRLPGSFADDLTAIIYDTLTTSADAEERARLDALPLDPEPWMWPGDMFEGPVRDTHGPRHDSIHGDSRFAPRALYSQEPHRYPEEVRP